MYICIYIYVYMLLYRINPSVRQMSTPLQTRPSSGKRCPVRLSKSRQFL